MDVKLIGSMIRHLARVMAMVTAISAIANAQCVVSCSLQSMPMRASAMGSGHACCPQDRGAQTHQQTQTKPCPQAASHANEARLEVKALAVAAPAVAMAAPMSSAPIPAGLTFTGRIRPPADSPGSGLRSPVVSLRI